jgi:hypothetical protein
MNLCSYFGARTSVCIWHRARKNVTEIDGDDPEGTDERYRTCSECGADCVPETVQTGQGIHVAFACSVHGVHTVIDPWRDSR